MTYVKVNDTLYPASITGKVHDREWDDRESKAITMEADFSVMNSLFPDNAIWSIVSEETLLVVDEEGTPILDANGSETYETHQTEFDNSEFSVRGDLIIHTDGTCTVKMGKETDLEAAYEIMYGGI